ncbi:MAG: hypothetical protein L0338_03580 [Acidobacteria bacterium]|nr:hypothetical protein [Acidobacteriota bacterium]
MINFQHQQWFRRFSHPSNEELIQFLDGELPDRSARKVAQHLQGCWQCRKKRERIENFVSAFMDQRNCLLAGSLSFPRHAIRHFETRVEKLNQETGRLAFFARALTSKVYGNLVSPAVLKAVACLAAGLICFVTWQRLSFVPSVSALEVVQRSQQAEALQLRQLNTSVVYQKLQARRMGFSSSREQTVTWEVWYDHSRSRLRQKVEDAPNRPAPFNGHPSRKGETQAASPSMPPMLAELEEIFEANRLDWRQPLSAIGYRAWSEALPKKVQRVRETLLPDGEKGLILATQVPGRSAVNAVRESEWVVRTRDWHPVQHRLQVQTEDGLGDYELSEVAYAVVALNALNPSIFADLTPLPPLRMPPSPALLVPGPRELLSAEVKAHYALHRLKACLGEPIQVVLEPSGRIEVRGLAKDEERKAELGAALSAIPLVTVKIQTIEEALQAASALTPVHNPSQAPPDEDVADSTTKIQSGRLPLQHQLEEHFRKERLEASFAGSESAKDARMKVAEFSKEMVSSSRSCLSEAWALRRLAEFCAREKSALPKEIQWLLHVMAQDHLIELKSVLSRTKSRLAPVLSNLKVLDTLAPQREKATPRPGQNRKSDWPGEIMPLFTEVEQLDRSIHILFAAETSPPESPEVMARELLFSLNRLEMDSAHLERRVAEELSDRPGQLSAANNP